MNEGHCLSLKGNNMENKVQLHTKSGHIFNVKYDKRFIEAGVLTYNESFYIFRFFKSGVAVFEETHALYIFPEEIINVEHKNSN
jgi:hypothetical protein